MRDAKEKIAYTPYSDQTDEMVNMASVPLLSRDEPIQLSSCSVGVQDAVAVDERPWRLGRHEARRSGCHAPGSITPRTVAARTPHHMSSASCQACITGKLGSRESRWHNFEERFRCTLNFEERFPHYT